MEDSQNESQTAARETERREALKRLGAIGIAVATAPAMITLLWPAKAASVQSAPEDMVINIKIS